MQILKVLFLCSLAFQPFFNARAVDGQLSAGEIPSEFKSMLSRIDTNQDGALDAAELKVMADSFAARRADWREGARDPIVYGAAAVEGSIVIRTGTRIYCVH